MSVLTHLLPDSNNLKLENCQLDEIKTQIKLIVSAINRVVNCPVCNQPTHKIHSRYERFLADLPWADYNITLQLRVRKFFCINTSKSFNSLITLTKTKWNPWQTVKLILGRVSGRVFESHVVRPNLPVSRLA
ncbi:transposase family protein [Nostoc sp. TCL240-02]|uniref:transposase family protein n=1 Tax=Nostoc sp. TCL240-02 TaxID=2572090 RepID=UPI0020C67107|nr:transposase family protein [Nostoc sp. TCL240-02]